MSALLQMAAAVPARPAAPPSSAAPAAPLPSYYRFMQPLQLPDELHGPEMMGRRHNKAPGRISSLCGAVAASNNTTLIHVLDMVNVEGILIGGPGISYSDPPKSTQQRVTAGVASVCPVCRTVTVGPPATTPQYAAAHPVQTPSSHYLLAAIRLLRSKAAEAAQPSKKLSACARMAATPAHQSPAR